VQLTHFYLSRILAHLDVKGLADENSAALHFLVHAQALLMASDRDEAASARWKAFAALSGKGYSRQGLEDLYRRLASATAAAELSGTSSNECLLSSNQVAIS
jgi:hypothetical protein